MKNKILTTIAAILLFAPWTILLLRTFPWALESPMAENMITCYAIGMILGGIFTVAAYVIGKVKNNLMKTCLVVNILYAAGGAAALGLMAWQGTL